MSSRPKRRPCAIIIRDGWGENPHREWDHANAVKVANPPVDARLRHECPFTLIATSGFDVGLPEGTMGNSEVGHQNIGAGRIVDQDSVRITKGVRDHSFFKNAELLAAVKNCQTRHSALHIMGLASDAGVHSRQEHLFACLKLAALHGLRSVFVHCFTDGRDTPPNSGVDWIAQIEGEMQRLGVGRIATVCGRYWAMDRDNRWPRTERAYRMLTEGAGERALSATAALQHYYAHPTEPTMNGDEFVPPTVIAGPNAAPIHICTGDSVIYYNFRGDRPRQMVQAFCLETFPFDGVDKTGERKRMGFERGPKLDLYFVTMTAYEASLPVKVAYPKPPRMANIGGEWLAKRGLRQFRAAETEKYAHVTFFFNDYREPPFPGEERLLVPSPKVATYDLQPEMSALPLTEGVLKRIATGVDDLLVINFANPDMVGHTGSLPAAVKACTVVDECVGRVLVALEKAGGCAIVTADHGNFEQMIDPQTGGPHTSHTTYTVPLYLVGGAFKGAKLRDGGRLADVMPTALEMLEITPPEEMTGRSLLQV